MKNRSAILSTIITEAKFHLDPRETKVGGRRRGCGSGGRGAGGGGEGGEGLWRGGGDGGLRHENEMEAKAFGLRGPLI